MKKKKWIRNIVILVLVLAALGGGITVGVRYFLANSGQSVEVYPVSQLNAADWINYSNDSVYGTVVSDVNQQVYIPDDKVINEVYVAQGDEVKIGDKLLSYDTTLLELDLELQELTVQEIDLEIESAEADLKKLKNTTPVAKSSSDDDELLGPNQSLPGDLDGGEEARMVPAKNLLLASSDTAPSSTEAQTASAQQMENQTDAQTEMTVQTDTANQTGTGDQTDALQTETSAQTDAGSGDSDEEQLITEPNEYININDVPAAGGAQGGAADGSLSADDETEKPKLNQSLEKLLAYIRVKEPGEAGENLLADTRDETGMPPAAQLSQDSVKLIPHFRETTDAHFERLDTYTMLIKGVTLKEDRSGMLYGTAKIDGNDYPEIGGYTLIRDEQTADVAHLTLAFHDGLEEQHEIAAELEDMYAEISLSAEEITGEKLIFRTAKAETDVEITVSRPADPPQTEEASETDTSEQPSEDTTDTGVTDTEPGTPDTGASEQPGTETEEEVPVTEPETDTEGMSGTETESETESEQESETESEAVPQNVVFDVTWYHGTNDEMKWPHSMDIDFYERTDEVQENSIWHQKISGSMEPEEEPDIEDQAGEEEPATDTEALPETGMDSTLEEEPSDVVLEEEEVPDNSYSSVHWVTGPFAWNAALNPQEYTMAVSPKNTLNYIVRAAWGRTDENGTKTCVITMTYLEPDDSPLNRLEPLSELDFWTGENGLYYKGSGTKEEPYVFFCVDGAVIKSSFVNWVLGFNEDGTERMRNADGTERMGYYVRLEIRESDSITGAFIKSVGLDGTIRMEYGYGPSTYWIFSSDTGIVRYEEEIPDEGIDGGWDDPGWIDTGDTYTAEELANAIAEKEREIRKLNVSKREAELKLKSYQKDMEESTVVSSVDGYVKSVGESSNSSDAYMVVASEGGLYLRTTVSEVNLDNVEKGDVLEGTSWETMSQFTATITEISYFPDTSNSGYYYYGSTNPNSSSYPVLARIEDGSGLSVSEMVEVKYRQKDGQSSDIYLSAPFIRSENGQSYVYKVGENGLLKKQYVHTGVTSNGYVEIKSGLSRDDSVAFPYGKNVKDGAKVKTEDEDTFSGYGIG